MRPQRRLCRHAFTLIELLITVTISVAVLAVVLDIFAFMTRQWGRQISYAMSIQQTSMALELMAREIHRGSSFAAVQVGSNTIYTFTLPALQDSTGATRYNSVQSFRITTTGMPASTVGISLMMTNVEGAQSRTYSSAQTVYMRNNNNSLGS